MAWQYEIGQRIIATKPLDGIGIYHYPNNGIGLCGVIKDTSYYEFHGSPCYEVIFDNAQPVTGRRDWTVAQSQIKPCVPAMEEIW